MNMFEFLLDMWVSGRVTAGQIQSYVGIEVITQEEADSILATPQDTE